MENASKALIMAAAVLIAVLVVSLIVYLVATFNQAKKNNAEALNNEQLAAFNSKYLTYDNRTDLTYYDIANIVTMARNDNKDNSEDSEDSGKIYVYIEPDLSNDLTDDANYNRLMNKFNKHTYLDNESDGILKEGTVIDASGRFPEEPTKEFIKYKCSVIMNDTRVSSIKFSK
jgi:hypothetical protein